MEHSIKILNYEKRFIDETFVDRELAKQKIADIDQALQLLQGDVMRRSEQLVCDKCIKGLNNSKTFEKGTCVHCRNKV